MIQFRQPVRWLCALVFLLTLSWQAIGQDDEKPPRFPEIQAKVQEFQQSQDWAGLATYLEPLLKYYPVNANLWFTYGLAHHMTKSYETAVTAWTKSVELNFQQKEIAYFNLACANSLLGNVDEGIKYLEKAAKAGIDVNLLENDGDIAALREDERFADILAKAKGEK